MSKLNIFEGTEIMTRLSVNINKIATLRNARGGNNPNVVKTAIDCERFGAQGITVHPRPDERHIRFSDVMDLKDVIKTEFNIEGYPDERYLNIVQQAKPAQATLVPDGPDAITSNAGWDTLKHAGQLKEIISEIKSSGIRVSVFVDPSPRMVEGAASIGADRIELYTEPYAHDYLVNKAVAVKPYVECARIAEAAGMGVNAGHDLDLNNLGFLVANVPNLDEVSIGHALICDAIYYGLENTIQLYLRQIANHGCRRLILTKETQMNIRQRLSDSDLQRVKVAVKDAENRISGEIVPIIVAQSGRYVIANYRGSLMAALFTFMSIIILDRYIISNASNTIFYDPVFIFVVVVLGGALGAIIPNLSAGIKRLLVDQKLSGYCYKTARRKCFFGGGSF